VLYDVLNKVALDSLFEPWRSYEVDLAERHLPHTQAEDLLVCDRNYGSYRFLATLGKQERAFSYFLLLGQGSVLSYSVYPNLFFISRVKAKNLK